MKAFANIFTLSALAVCLTACNDDIGTGSNLPAEESEGIYLKFALDLPSGSGSRSKTDTEEGEDYGSSSDGTEVSKDRENRISQIMLVFTDEDNNYLTSTNVTSVSPTTSTVNEYVITIPPERLADYVSPEPEQGEEAQQRVANVYAYCNPTPELRALAGAAEGSTEVTNFIQKAHTITDDKNASVWQDNNFLMSNAVKRQIDLPTSWYDNLSSSSAFDIGTIKVERSVARFDYKAVHDDNKYVVRDNLESQDEESKKNPGIYIQLTDVALINMSKSFYYLRRVSKNGQNTEATICGVETANNYVVDTDAADKLKYTTASNWPNKRDNFFYNLEKPDTWKWTSLAAISKNEEDNTIEPEDKKGYHIWRYAIENTIPQDNEGDDELQKNGITTGVVFRAKIGREDNSDVTWTDGNDIYVFDDVLYGDWNAVREYAKEHPNEDVAYAYEAVESGDYEPEKAGFTIYTQNEDGNYYAYYYYWNRHHDNEKEPDMGPMEFAVVRNNVYKLSVEAIYRFGYPEGETPDSETPDEEEPKEDPGPDPEPDPEVFLKVNVQVLPWVVRENEISFGDKDTGTN
ncbi:hypothetical protein Bacsa_1473 [Phocaeicola salanitronis DSM 18170]|uniref:Minor fimbrium subunit Mfa1 C-terminal domain-containing protein n=1 Tax=Phocaeicola salanitronis (strain DSM 18170 / JCM 13657 / CCUG 60908 / BL78) TaxID=667015 RepID=F0QZ16_PHOSB|nr:Mfa1 family fimbria major subunit [Phocaeicola salanitronis]ADY36045.1 hypothetical protein Bacsa_1473 [Phocaeicola salanitronis DSM 18170]